MTLYSPFSSVTTERDRSISAGLNASTVTPGNTAPDVSRTTPAIAPPPVLVCAEAALATMLIRGRDVALVFADVRLPGVMDGVDLAREVKIRWPHLTVVVTSGNPGERTPKSLLFVPMMAQNEVVGVLELDQDDRVRDFSADVQALAQHLGNQIGVAIRLMDRRSVQEQLFRTEKLAAIGRSDARLAAS